MKQTIYSKLLPPLTDKGCIGLHRSTEIAIWFGTSIDEPGRMSLTRRMSPIYEHCLIYPQPQNLGNRVFFESKLDPKDLINS